MATSLHIEMASRTPTAPAGRHAIDSAAVDNIPNADPLEFEQAREYAKRLANRHACTGTGCTHPRHADDVAACLTALIMIGLAPDPYPTVRRKSKISLTVTHAPQARKPAVPDPLIDTARSLGREWVSDAACRHANPELFFAPDGERQPEREIREAEAKRVCDTCPVVDACGKWALTRPEPHGVWGGLGEDQLDSLQCRRVGVAA